MANISGSRDGTSKHNYDDGDDHDAGSYHRLHLHPAAAPAEKSSSAKVIRIISDKHCDFHLF